METVQNSEDLFLSQEKITENQVDSEATQPDNSDETASSLTTRGNENSGGNAANIETSESAEKETPDLVFSEDIDFGEQSEKIADPEVTKALPEVVNQPTIALSADDTEKELTNDMEEELTNAIIEDLNEETEVDQSEENAKAKESPEERLAQFPFARIKQIMKLDPDVGMVSAEAIFVVTKAAELFLQTLAKDTSSYTLASKKKTMGLRDVEFAIENVDSLMFLDGMMKVN